MILETAVQDDKVMQDFEFESLLMGGDHSQKVKAPPIRSDYGSKDCVNLSSSTAVSRMTPFRADLHCHSTCSDGSMNPIELLNLAIQVGLNALSITDHDSIDAYTPETLAKANELELELVSGVEFSTTLDLQSIHILGYDFSLENHEIATFCEKHKIRRQKRLREILKLLTHLGMPIDEENLLQAVAESAPFRQSLTIGRPHIAQMMVNLGYVHSIQEAFKKYLGDGCSCYVQGEHITPEETIEVIHQAGGAAIIAHPHLIKEPSILKKLMKMNFDGIECYYSKFLPHDHARWLKIANQRSWLITGGSDFHGDIKPLITLGCSWIDDQHLRRLLNHDLRHTH